MSAISGVLPPISLLALCVIASTNPPSPPNSFNATLSAYLTSDFPKGLIMGFTKSIPVVAIPLTTLWAKRKMPPPANVATIDPPVFKPPPTSQSNCFSKSKEVPINRLSP